MSKKAKRKPQCLTPGCDQVGGTRGLCHRCYSAAQTMVKNGTLAWEKLVKLGLALHSRRESGTRKLFRDAVAQALQGNPPGRPAEAPAPESAPEQPPESAPEKSSEKPTVPPWQQ